MNCLGIVWGDQNPIRAAALDKYGAHGGEARTMLGRRARDIQWVAFLEHHVDGRRSNTRGWRCHEPSDRRMPTLPLNREEPISLYATH